MTGHRHRRASAGGRAEIAIYECSGRAADGAGCQGSYLSAPKAHRLLAETMRALSESVGPGAPEREFSLRGRGGPPPRRELRGRLARYPRQLERLLRRYRAGRLSAEDYAQARRRLEAERRSAARSLDPAPPSRPEPPSPADSEEPLRGLADVVESNRFSIQMKKDLLREAFDHIIIERDGTVRLWVRT
jgi:hypothetical protein